MLLSLGNFFIFSFLRVLFLFRNHCPNKNCKLKLLGSSRPPEVYSIFTTNLNSKCTPHKDKILCILLYASPFKRQIIMLPSTVKIPRPLISTVGRTHFFKTKSYVFDKQINYTSRIHVEYINRCNLIKLI